jgi:hypothetical protein
VEWSRLNNSAVVATLQSAVDWIAKTRVELLDYRNLSILDDIKMYSEQVALAVLLVTLWVLMAWGVSFVVLPCLESGKFCQFTGMTVLVSILCVVAMVLSPIGVVMRDGCAYVDELEQTKLKAGSSDKVWRGAYACLHNQPMLPTLDINVTQVLDMDEWVVFPDTGNFTVVPIANVTANATHLEEARVDAMLQCIDRIETVHVVLDPLAQSVRDVEENAVCGSMGPAIDALRDRMCMLPTFFIGLGVSLSLFVAFFLVGVSLRACHAPRDYVHL